jgi:2-desacetyl-2-hydroxyethyl bacteriochlorophyllide A dehydrogenase
MKRLSLYFTSPRAVEVREEELPPLGAGQVLVMTVASAISPGTEMLIYRGQAPMEMAADDTISALGGSLAFPLKYGYAAVGRVVERGAGVGPEWEGRLVFAFHPHESLFIAEPSQLLPVPPDLTANAALFLPNTETAVNFLLDGHPLLGERVAVVGQGVVGLLTTALLARFPLAQLVTFDHFPLRREWALRLGAGQSLEPSHMPDMQADLVFELSGSPAALDTAMALTGFDGRIVIGSWYGQKRAAPDLGGRFHRSRLRLISSQVSTLTPALMGRWTKARRLAVAWEMVRAVDPARLITQRVPLANAAQAYQLIDHHPEECVQVVLAHNQ